MKKLLTGLLLALFALSAAAETAADEKGIKFYKGSWDELMREAKKQNKPFFIDFWASWCGPCKMLNATTFRDERVGEMANKHFIPYKMDVDQADGKMLSAKYQISSIPTIVFFSSKGEEIGRFSGYKPAEGFMAEMQKYIDPAAQRKSKKDDKKAGASAKVTFEQYAELKADYTRQVIEPEAFKNDSLRVLVEEARKLGGRKEDLLLEDLRARARKQGLSEQTWILDAAYQIGARQYGELVKQVHPRFEGRQIENQLLHWFCIQFISADLDDIPAEPMQWVNALARNGGGADVLDTKAALLLRDKKYEYAAEVSREAQKNALLLNQPDDSAKILEQLAEKGI